MTRNQIWQQPLVYRELKTEMPEVKKTKKKVNVTNAIEELNHIQSKFLYNPDEMQKEFEKKSTVKASYTIRNKKAN